MTICFRARGAYIGKQMHPPISWGEFDERHGSSHSQTSRPITLWVLHMRGAQTTEVTNTLWSLSVAGCQEYKTFIISLPAEFQLQNHRTSEDLVESEPIKKCP